MAFDPMNPSYYGSAGALSSPPAEEIVRINREAGQRQVFEFACQLALSVARSGREVDNMECLNTAWRLFDNARKVFAGKETS